MLLDMKYAMNYKTHYVMHPPSLTQTFVQQLIKQRDVGGLGRFISFSMLICRTSGNSRRRDALMKEQKYAGKKVKTGWGIHAETTWAERIVCKRRDICMITLNNSATWRSRVRVTREITDRASGGNRWKYKQSIASQGKRNWNRKYSIVKEGMN